MKSKLIVVAFLFSLSSLAQITDHIRTVPPDFSLKGNKSIDIYCSANVVELKEGNKTSQDARQQLIIDKAVELFRQYISTVNPKYGANKLPSIYSGKITLNGKEEMQKFLKKTETEFIFIIYNVTSSEKSYTNQGSGIYWNPGSGNKTKMSFELWDVKKQSIILDFEISESGNTWIDVVLFKAIEFVKKKGEINKE